LERRELLKTGAALAALGLVSTPHRVWAQAACAPDSWGGIDGSVAGAGSPWTCANYQPKKILEIFLLFGGSLWETFWLSGSATAPDFTVHGMDEFDKPGYPSDVRFADLKWDPDGTPCLAPDMPASRLDASLFGTASDQEKIYWGASTKPLYLRADILSRARLVTQFHDLFPHDAAIPYSVTGLKRGNPRFAGTGAAIQRRAIAIDPTRRLPASYILHSGSTGSDFWAEYFAATGVHPGYARPVVIKVQDTDAFYTALGRSGITPDSDRLLSALRHEYRDRLRFQGAGDPVRSAGFASYWAAAELLDQSQPLQALFANQVLVIDHNIAVCARQDPQARQTPAEPSLKTMLNAAARLLTSTTGAAQYVGIIDTGIAATYDTHAKDHLLTTNANFYNLSYHLAHLIKHPTNNPSGLIDLDETMVLISSEFGRTNYVNGTTFGRDHWPSGYASLLIGGPIPVSTSGGTILGAIGRADGITLANYRYSPTDIRGATLLAAGVDPFAPGNFRFSDFSDVIQSGISTEAAIRERLRRNILGA
jgi:hypothetical protein